MDLKKCSECGKEKPSTGEHFRVYKTINKNGKKKVYLSNICKDCYAITQKKYRQKHVSELKKYRKNYRLGGGKRGCINKPLVALKKPFQDCSTVWENYTKCPYVSCPHHVIHLHPHILASSSPSKIIEFIEDLPETCTLNLIKFGGVYPNVIAEKTNLNLKTLNNFICRTIYKIKSTSRLNLLEDWA